MAQSATNYAEKYSDELAQAYLQSSIIAGKTNTEYTFDGVKTVHVYSAVTQPLQDYKRSGTWRYGQPYNCRCGYFFRGTSDGIYTAVYRNSNNCRNSYIYAHD